MRLSKESRKESKVCQIRFGLHYTLTPCLQTGFVESSKVLMNVLDDVAKIHPFIGIAVLAFKAVVTLEMKRRSNDAKVVALKLRMRDMMATLLQLQTIQDPEIVNPNDGLTIEGRMQQLMVQIAEDIKQCGNACDKYSKNGVVCESLPTLLNIFSHSHCIVRVIKSPIWEGRLAQYADVFAERKKEIHFALASHTALGVDTANRNLLTVQADISKVNHKLDMLLLFRRLESPKEKELAALIEKRGGIAACLQNEEALDELASINAKNTGPKLSADVSSTRDTTERGQFKKQLEATEADVDDSIKSNMMTFERKLEIQKKQLVQEMEELVHREGDRVIDAICAGPHDRILDQDLHHIWKEMVRDTSSHLCP